MAFQHNVWHVQAMGTSYTGAEQWSMGFWLGNETADVSVPTVTYANLIYARVKTLFANSTVPISWAFTLNDLKIQHYLADGTMNTANTTFQSGGAPQAGQSSGNVPPQNALAISFRGVRTRGPGANGRMYLPGINTNLTSGGKIETTVVDAIKAAAKTMFDGINSDLATPGAKLILATPGGTSPVTAPANILVTTLRCGDVVDTIQRRRRGLREVYRTSALA